MALSAQRIRGRFHTVPVMARAPSAGQGTSTPKLLNALPKNTAVMPPAKNTARSRRGPIAGHDLDFFAESPGYFTAQIVFS